MDNKIAELLAQYRKYQIELAHGDNKNDCALNGMRHILKLLKAFPLPVCAGDRVVSISNKMEGTVIFVDSECAVVRYDNSVTFEAYNAYQVRMHLFRI